MYSRLDPPKEYLPRYRMKLHQISFVGGLLFTYKYITGTITNGRNDAFLAQLWT